MNGSEEKKHHSVLKGDFSYWDRISRKFKPRVLNVPTLSTQTDLIAHLRRILVYSYSIAAYVIHFPVSLYWHVNSWHNSSHCTINTRTYMKINSQRENSTSYVMRDAYMKTNRYFGRKILRIWCQLGLLPAMSQERPKSVFVTSHVKFLFCLVIFFIKFSSPNGFFYRVN